VAANPFSSDRYIHERHARSILCLPLINQAKLIGVLYLENNLAPRVFAPGRITVLKLLASQAAISLEITGLYRDLAEREAKIGRLVDANIIGIFIWDFEGRIIEANDAFLHMVGYDRDDLVSDRMRWTELRPSEWSPADPVILRAKAELRTTGTCKAFEKEYLRKDGTRVPVLLGAAAFGGGSEQGVAFVIDLTERKQAEEHLRDSEQRYREVQMELAHANRVATMGQLSASIAHEINQPIAAAVTYANAALRWLGAHPPNLEEVREALGLILESGVRAGEVMDRIRALVKKAPPQKDSLEMNEVILEVIDLTSREMEKNGISAQTQLAENLPPIHGDRVQLQQVVLNLLVNAIEAMSGMSEEPREVLINTTKTDPGILISVRDSGPGFTPEGVERLFESFYTTKLGGLGMGLSICRSIIEAHGGRLWASANEPRGAVFQFTLPA
jgi:PAS domain S-box-containing protein